eukprot:COSAG02_NODE_756_length_17532_cov_5.673550_20_plen_53_part_00
MLGMLAYVSHRPQHSLYILLKYSCILVVLPSQHSCIFYLVLIKLMCVRRLSE